MALSTFSALFGERAFQAFIVVRCASLLATQMLTLSVGWRIYSLTGDPFDVALLGLVQFSPAFLLFFATGYAADRFERRSILILCLAVQALAALACFAATMGSGEAVAIYLSVIALHGTARAFLNPVLRAILPGLVPPQLFPNAVACNSLFSKMATLTGPLVGGLLLAAFGSWIYAIVAALFATACLAAFLVRPRLATGPSKAVPISAFLEGARYVFQNKVLLGAMSLDLVSVTFGTVLGIMPVYAKDVLQVGAQELGLLRSMPAFGALLTALWLTQIASLRASGKILLVSLGIYACAIVGLGLSSSFLLSVAMLLVYGAADMTSMYIRQTMVQLATPDRMRGRVGAVESLLSNGSEELGNFRAGSVAAAIGVGQAIVAGGIVTLLVPLIWWKLFPQIGRLDRLTDASKEAA